MIKKLIQTFLLKQPSWGIKFNNYFAIKCHVNVNLNILDERQKRVLLCYLDLEKINQDKVMHANRMHFYQMLKSLIDMGYCVDVCACEDELAYEVIKGIKYDIILGQGKLFKKMCKQQPDSRRILFVTENLPTIASKKYAERLSYFKQRHSDFDCHNVINRIGYNGYIDEEMFSLAEDAIVMNSEYNISLMDHYFNHVYPINSNAIFNKEYIFDAVKLMSGIGKAKYNFLWFGSAGLIHKGVDILVDAFKEMPECSVDFYGIGGKERKMFDSIKAANTNDCGYVNVLSSQFIESVVNTHCFVIFPSCSEGMSTAVATCMAHGFIPIVTKECGFNPCECIIELNGWRIDDIKYAVRKATAMSDKDILILRKKCYDYARENFSLKSFNTSFKRIMQLIAE